MRRGVPRVPHRLPADVAYPRAAAAAAPAVPVNADNPGTDNRIPDSPDGIADRKLDFWLDKRFASPPASSPIDVFCRFSARTRPA